MPFADPRDARIAELERQLAERDARIAELEKLLAAALARIADLEARLGQNSTNSSKPPSSDPPGTMRKLPKAPSGRKPGGQPGHPKRERELLPVDQVDKVVDLIPDRCGECQRPLRGKDPTPQRHQLIEVPPVAPHVTEYRCHQLGCECGATTRAELPPEARSAWGERLNSIVALCTGEYRLSKRTTQQLLSDLLGVDIALGSVSNIEQEVSAALAAPVEQARAFVKEQPIVNADETGWREGKAAGKSLKAWLWTAVTPLVTVFLISRSRGKDAAKALLGEGFKGFLGTDRWSAYNWVDVIRRQLCWSHITRDIQGFIDRGGVGARIGKSLMSQRNLMFKWWHRVRDGTLPRATFIRRMRRVEKNVGRLLREAVVCAESKTAGMAKEMLKLEPALWTFVRVEGLEPTNNISEQQVRCAVQWRKTSFGTQSPEGSRFVERILSATATLRQQKRNVLEYLTAACSAYRRGHSIPSLLPNGAHIASLAA